MAWRSTRSRRSSTLGIGLLLAGLGAAWNVGGKVISASAPARTFLLAAETRQAIPVPPAPKGSGVDAMNTGSTGLDHPGPGSAGGGGRFCGWACFSLTSVAVVLCSRERRQKMRGAWRRMMVRARALAAPWLQIVLPAEAPSSPSSYAAALMHPPTLDFLRGQHAEEDSDEEEPFPNARRGPAFGKTRSLPSRLALATEDSDEDSPRPSAWTFQKTNSLPTPCCQLPETTLVLGDAKDDAPRSTVARTLLEQRPVQTCKGWTPELSSKPQLAEEVFSQIPSVQNLRRMFIVKVSQMESCEAAVHAATEELNRTCKVGFQDSDAERIYSMLSQNGKDEISCQSFAVGMRELLCALTSCGSQLSLPQLRIIMATAFDRFDRNDDGVLSVEEFSSALRSFDIHMGIEETASLLRFLGPVCEQESPVLEREDLANVDGSELTLEEKCSAAVNAMQEKVKSAIGWNTAVQIGEKVNECWQEPGSPGHKVQRLLDLGHKELATATEASLTVAGIAAVLLHHSQFHADAAFFEQMHDAVDDFMGAVKDLEASVILPALVSGALGLAKTQKDSVALDVEEAFLYVRYFLSKGCSQSLFHKLINLADCHWGSVSAGEPLPEAKGELQILVRGKVVMKHGEDEVELLPGAFLNSCCDSQQPPEEVALEDVTYVAWDTEKLQEWTGEKLGRLTQISVCSVRPVTVMVAYAMLGSSDGKGMVPRTAGRHTALMGCDIHFAGDPMSQLDVEGCRSHADFHAMDAILKRPKKPVVRSGSFSSLEPNGRQLPTESFGTQVEVVSSSEIKANGVLSCAASSMEQITYTLPAGAQGNQTEGELRLEQFAPIPWAVAHTKAGSTFVGSAGRWRYTALATPHWDWRRSAERPSTGRAADLELSGGAARCGRCANSPVFFVQLRDATAAEVKRSCQQQALSDAQEADNYDELFAQVTKARLAAVELEYLERAEEKLKLMRKQRMHVATGCGKEDLRRQMSWDLITRPISSDTEQPCPNTHCSSNEVLPGEILSITPQAVDAHLGPGSDRLLFDKLVEAALASEEGSVWPAGGKLIFSAFDRNQSVNSLVRTLEGAGQEHCAQMMLKLVEASETTYGGFVSAVQVNFHRDGESFHDQHRDVYSAKQRAGPNCACSFRECVGTAARLNCVCYSLGSSRLCRLCSMFDNFSSLKRCGDSCQGRQEDRWLRSGDAMFFNARWNQNHTHGR
ncbi:unnamed protein product [Durusdinium trenchii]|uniref:EF-hand domain-containing protein n=1 Tax=Durusdinium trenchii TaxID=1381693 RepID=A0ABP0KQW8_9DINO